MKLIPRIMCMIFLSSCSHYIANTSPNILANAPYNDVRYLKKQNAKIRKVDRVEVVTKGDEANILNTIPKLYEKALNLKNRSPSSLNRKNQVFISNFTFEVQSKLEDYQVPYQDCKTQYVYKNVTENQCKTEYQSVNQSHYECTGYGASQHCGTNYRTVQQPVTKCGNVSVYKNVQEQKCETKYKTEQRWVLYQIASADVYR